MTDHEKTILKSQYEFCKKNDLIFYSIQTSTHIVFNISEKALFSSAPLRSHETLTYIDDEFIEFIENLNSYFGSGSSFFNFTVNPQVKSQFINYLFSTLSPAQRSCPFGYNLISELLISFSPFDFFQNNEVPKEKKINVWMDILKVISFERIHESFFRKDFYQDFAYHIKKQFTCQQRHEILMGLIDCTLPHKKGHSYPEELMICLQNTFEDDVSFLDHYEHLFPKIKSLNLQNRVLGFKKEDEFLIEKLTIDPLYFKFFLKDEHLSPNAIHLYINNILDKITDDQCFFEEGLRGVELLVEGNTTVFLIKKSRETNFNSDHFIDFFTKCYEGQALHHSEMAKQKEYFIPNEDNFKIMDKIYLDYKLQSDHTSVNYKRKKL